MTVAVSYFSVDIHVVKNSCLLIDRFDFTGHVFIVVSFGGLICRIMMFVNPRSEPDGMSSIILCLIVSFTYVDFAIWSSTLAVCVTSYVTVIYLYKICSTLSCILFKLIMKRSTKTKKLQVRYFNVNYCIFLFCDFTFEILVN